MTHYTSMLFNIQGAGRGTTTRFSATKLRSNLYRMFDRVLKTGVPVEIERKGKVLKIVPVEPADKLKNLRPRANYLLVSPESIVHLDWPKEWRL